MIEALSRLGVGGGVGFLVGLGVALWVGHMTPGGTATLIVVCMVTVMVLGAIISKLFKKKENTEIFVDRGKESDFIPDGK